MGRESLEGGETNTIIGGLSDKVTFQLRPKACGGARHEKNKD
jgi:hypothetical protein